MKQKILELLPRAGALLAALVVLISCVAVPARAAFTSEAVQYYDILDFDMFGTLTGGATAKETFDVADYMSLYGESYSYSSWSLLITGEFDGTKLVTSYGATYYSSTACSYQFTLSKDWLKDPSIKVQQENPGVTGRYRITGAYLINSSYTSQYSSYFYQISTPWSLSQIYNHLYNFQPVSDSDIFVDSGSCTTYFSPRIVIPCTTLYFEFEVEGLTQEDFALSVMSLSSQSSSLAVDIYDYDLTLLFATDGYYRYGVEVTGPFTDIVFVALTCNSVSPQSEVTFSNFYAGYNRILNTNSLLEQIREQTTQIRSYLNKMRTRLDEIASNLADILQRIANGELGSKPATNIFDAWNGTISGLSSSFQSVVNAINGIAGSVSTALSSSFNSVTSAVEGIAGDVSNALSSSFDSLMDATSSIAGDVSAALSSSFDSVTDAVEGIAGDLISGMPDIVGAVSDVPGKIVDAITPIWQSNAFGVVDFTGIVDFFSSGYNSISGIFGFVDIFEDPDGGIGWLPSEDTISDSETTPFISGLRGFWTFSGALVMELPSEVILAFSFVFIGFLFVGFLKSF